MVTGILPKALSQNATASKPNVIFILADNLGWSDLGCYGGTAPAPRLDQLASQGMRFKNYNVCAVDWLPTLAKMVGAENSVPTDRPIDGIDSADLFLGRSEKSNRDYLVSHGPDGQVWAVKWKTMKVVLKYSEVLSGPTITPGWPMVFDLINDPSESTDLMAAELDCGWVFAPVFGRILALSKSAEKYPHIKPGQDFTGYTGK